MGKSTINNHFLCRKLLVITRPGSEKKVNLAVAQVDVTIPENAFGGQAMWVQDWIRALVGGFFPKKKMGGSARQRVK